MRYDSISIGIINDIRLLNQKIGIRLILIEEEILSSKRIRGFWNFHSRISDDFNKVDRLSMPW